VSVQGCTLPLPTFTLLQDIQSVFPTWPFSVGPTL